LDEALPSKIFVMDNEPNHLKLVVEKYVTPNALSMSAITQVSIGMPRPGKHKRNPNHPTLGIEPCTTCNGLLDECFLPKDIL